MTPEEAAAWLEWNWNPTGPNDFYPVVKVLIDHARAAAAPEIVTPDLDDPDTRWRLFNHLSLLHDGINGHDRGVYADVVAYLAKGAPPAEPEIVTATVVLFKPSGKYYTEEQWQVPDNAIGPYDMSQSPDFRRISGGAVLVPTQEPWGYPHLIPEVTS